MKITLKQLSCIAGGCVLAGTVIGGCVIWMAQSRLYDSNTNAIANMHKHWPSYSNVDELSINSIHVITKFDELERIEPLLTKDLKHIKLLGLDCEWTSTKEGSSPVALLQLSTASGLCLLIRLCIFTGNFPQFLKDILQDKDILKVGVGPYNDCRKLFSDHGIVVNGCVDLRSLVVRDREAVIKSLSLRGLASLYLNVSMDKSKSIQCSDWEAETLSNKQITYAANDAFVGVKVFLAFIEEKLQRSSRLEGILNTAITDTLWGVACSYCQGLKDAKFRDTRKKKTNHDSNKASPRIKPKSLKSYSTRKFPLYDNCKLQAPDGQLLSTCDKKKAIWYIEKQLADVISEEPFTVRLRFEPAGRPASNRDYYLFDKENICVVCGLDGSIVRKNVVPHEYRKHFPLVLKDHVSHDIVPLCVPCHRRASFYDHLLRGRLADEYEAPIGSMQAVQLLEDPERRSVRSAGRALKIAGDKIPQPRKDELEQLIKDFYVVTTLTDGILLNASELETRYKNEAYIKHGEKVVNSIFNKDKLLGLISFEKRWRQHFLSAMQPTCLPKLWSVEHNHDRLLERDIIENESITS